MNIQDYLKTRLDDQIKWYSEKSIVNQKKYKQWQVIKIAVALAIPVLTLGIEDWSPLKYIIGILGALVAFLESYMRIYNFKDLWTSYRISSESLLREKLKFNLKAAPYEGDNRDKLLVERCEDIMNSENSSWKELVGQEESD